MIVIVDDSLKLLEDLTVKHRYEKDITTKDKLAENVFKIIEDLKTKAISKFYEDSDIKRFLDNLVRFNNYSYNNLLLISLQKPTASYVASRKTFYKMGYSLKDGAKEIKVYIPNFYSLVKIQRNNGEYDIVPYFTLKPDEIKKYKDKNDSSITFYKQKISGFSFGTVFDASDATMPLDAIDEELNPVLDDVRASEVKDCLIKVIYKDKFKVKYEDLHGTEKGHCDFKNKTIVIRNGLSDLMQVKVLIHEYAHALAHKHLEDNYLDYKEHRNKYETEAESISYVVSNYLGLKENDHSLTYLYAWSKNQDFKEIDDSLSTILNYSKKIINNYEKFYEKEFGLYAEDYKKMNI